MASVTFPPALGGDGSTVTDDANATTGLANGGHRARFVPALAQTVAVMNGGIAAAQTQVSLAAAQVALAAGQVALATTQANNSATSAANAAMSAGATVWVSGTTYAIGDTRYSPVTNQIYRRKTAGAGTTDPSADSTNWALVMLDAVTNYPTIKPSLNLDFANTKTLDPRITFSRASTATYYDGKTFAKAEENLLTYSQEFDNAGWAKPVSIVTANATAAPDGTSTADKVAADSSNDYKGVYQFTPFQNGATYTLSVYVKSSEYTKFYISDLNAGRFYCSFDIGVGTAGTPGGTYTGISASIVAVANGYYRCSITFTSTETANRAPAFVGYPNTGATLTQFGAQYTGDGTSGIYIWGAQLEQRSSATAYIPTTSQPITNYIPVLQTAASNTPRFDHNPTTGESLGLLIEEQRTNLLIRSQEFDDVAWVKSSATVSANQVVAPDGTLSADLIQEAAIAGVHYVRFGSVSLTSGATYTASVYVKSKERSSVNLVSYNGASDTISVFNLNSYTVTSGSGSIVHIGNGWCKVSQQFTQTTTGANTFAVQIHLNNGSGNNYTGDGYSGIYIWGAQLEAGSFPTSYIPTTTAQVTRSADAASMTGSNFSSWYRQDEGTIYAESKTFGTGARAFWGLSGNGANENTIAGWFNPTASSAVIASGVIQGNAFMPAVVGDKSAIAFKQNDVAGAISSTLGTVDTSAILPVVTSFQIGDMWNSATYKLNGTIKKISYWPSRLSNSVIQALTT